MQINLLSFGSLTEVLQSGKINALEIMDSNSLKDYLIARHPELSTKKFLLAINKNIVQANTVLQEGDTVAVLPPFSGG